MVIHGTTLLGSSAIEVAAGGTLTGGNLLLLSGSLTTNAGTIDSGFETTNGGTLINSGELTARGGLELEGPLFNSGRITSVNGPVEFTYGSTVVNSCVITAPTDDVIVTSSSSIVNSGLVEARAANCTCTGSTPRARSAGPPPNPCSTTVRCSGSAGTSRGVHPHRGRVRRRERRRADRCG